MVIWNKTLNIPEFCLDCDTGFSILARAPGEDSGMLLEWCLEAQNKHTWQSANSRPWRKRSTGSESEPFKYVCCIRSKNKAKKNWLTHFSVGSRVHSILFTMLIRNVLRSGVPGWLRVLSYVSSANNGQNYHKLHPLVNSGCDEMLGNQRPGGNT